jgi:hypothetical protein
MGTHVARVKSGDGKDAVGYDRVEAWQIKGGKVPKGDEWPKL